MKKLYIDLDKCQQCKECKATCEYFFSQTAAGVTSLREYATFALFCRHCEEAPCVNSCYHEALERQADGHLKRYKLRCTSCKSCSIACPFGTILVDFIPYLDSKCDYCLEGGELRKIPSCAKSCPESAISVKDFDKEDPENDVYFVEEHLAVHSKKWSREEVVKRRR